MQYVSGIAFHAALLGGFLGSLVRPISRHDAGLRLLLSLDRTGKHLVELVADDVGDVHAENFALELAYADRLGHDKREIRKAGSYPGYNAYEAACLNKVI